jgi:kynureninase
MKSYDLETITGRQLQAARVLAGLTADSLARAATVGIATLRRAEARGSDPISMTTNNARAVVQALENAGVVLFGRNGGGPGVRLK